jgi:imidazoleglycerol-phosphate dehydratase
MDPEKILVASPTFAMYRFFALLQKTAIVDVLRGPAPEFALDVDEMIKEIRNGCKLVFIASPNNPTGNCTTNDIVRRLCAEECIVVMDEAYAEFADEHCLPLVAEYPNLMVMRTFSKWAGLAGVRCGFVVAHPSLVNAMMQIKQPYNISVAADIAATYSLDHSDRVFVAVRAMRYERYRMMSQLNSFSFLTPLPSDANFLLVDTGCVDSREIQAALRAKGVLVRCYAGGSSKALEPFIRISCGRPQDTDKLMQVLKDLDPTPAKSGKISILSEMGAPKCVLWDMDGVLAEVGSSYRLAIIRTAAHFGVTLSDDDIRKAKNLGNANNDWVLTQRLVNAVKGAGSVTLEAVTDHFQSLYVGVGGGPGLRDSEMLIPTKAFLTAAARKYPMAVVTGRPRDECMHFLATHGLTDLFKVFVCMEDGPAKPSPAPVLSALKQLGLQHTEGFSYMIGDTVDDVKAALAANCNVVGLGFLPPSESTPFTAKCDIVAALYEAGCARVLYDMRQLEEILLGTPFEIYDAPSALTPAPPKALAAPHHAVSASAPAALAPTGRYSKISRKTSETFVEVELWIDGTGQSKINTGLGFLDHMITALSKHSRFDLNITCKGDTWIDDHHTTEDVALTLGACLLEAMGDKRGITRFGNAYCPLDEALCRAVIDISGRPHSEVSLDLKRDMVGQVSSEMLAHFLRSLATEARITLHVDVLKGINDHHKAECAYKATAVALRLALARTAINDVPSTKGCL